MKATIKTKRTFDDVYSRGVRVHGKYQVLFLLEGSATSAENGTVRVGIVASRKVGGAVRRNRAKRVLRESLRANQTELPRVCDVVLVARRNLVDANVGTNEVSAELRDLIARAIGPEGTRA